VPGVPEDFEHAVALISASMQMVIPFKYIAIKFLCENRSGKIGGVAKVEWTEQLDE
jgi:hypothetical protein